jgi:hypothetical protein
MNAVSAIKRDLVCSLLFKQLPRIVVASSGRAGSTMVHDAVANGLVTARFPAAPHSTIATKVRRWSSGFVPRLGQLASGHCVVAKTHDLFRFCAECDCKYIFVYGDPLESALSVRLVVEEHGAEWFNRHQAHLGGSGSYADLFRKDVLNYRNQLESWLTQNRSDVLCIDYEDIWRERTRLSEFLQFNVALPLRHPRAPKPKPANVDFLTFIRLRELKARLKRQYLAYREHTAPSAWQPPPGGCPVNSADRWSQPCDRANEMRRA